jgi:hypothetical protein
MKTLMIAAAAAAALLGAPVALAATTSSKAATEKAESHKVVDTTLSSRCTALSRQFDRTEATHKADKDYKETLALGTEGTTLCSSNKLAAGVEYLGSAVKMFGTSSS